MTPPLVAPNKTGDPRNTQRDLRAETPTESLVSHRACPLDSAAGEAEAGLAPTDRRIGTLLPADLLQPGEIVILMLKPSVLFVVLYPLSTLLLIAGLTVATVVLNTYFPVGLTTNREIVLIGLMLILFRIGWQFVEWLSRAYVLTDRRVIRVQGVLRMSIYECPLTAVQQTEVVRSFREQLAGLGTLAFATSGSGFYDAFWNMIERPIEVQQQVSQTLRRYRR